MTPPHIIAFQLIVIPVLGLLFVRSLYRVLRGYHRHASVIAAVIWLAGALTILRPQITIRIAAALGIGRGADLILYIFVIAFLVSVFYFYSRLLHLEASLTQIVRQLALRDAVSPDTREPEHAITSDRHPS